MNTGKVGALPLFFSFCACVGVARSEGHKIHLVRESRLAVGGFATSVLQRFVTDAQKKWTWFLINHDKLANLRWNVNKNMNLAAD